MTHNIPSNISVNSSFYSKNKTLSLVFVYSSANPSFTSQIKTTANSTKVFASARACSGYTNPQTIVANTGFNIVSTSTDEAQKQSSGQKFLALQDLVNNRFILHRVDDKPFVASNKGKLSEPSFDNNLRMSGDMGHYFSGKATLNDDQLKTEGLFITPMLSNGPQLKEIACHFL